MKKLEMNLVEVKDFISNGALNDKIYIGCDSITNRQKNGKWIAEFITVVVIHRNGNSGCKIFGRLEIEPDYSQNKSKPIMRLINEAVKSATLYEELKESIGGRYREIHLDINPDKKYNSQLALSQAVGYIRAMTNLDPVVKPNAFAASSCADRFMRVKGYDIVKISPNIKRRKMCSKSDTFNC